MCSRTNRLLLAEAHTVLSHLDLGGGLKDNNEMASLLPQERQLLSSPTQTLECSRPTEHVHSQMDQKIHSWLLLWWQLHPNANPTPQ